jgi:hypothetical protein
MIKQVGVKFDSRSVVFLLQYFKHFETVSAFTPFLHVTQCCLHNFILARYKNKSCAPNGNFCQEYVYFSDELFMICIKYWLYFYLVARINLLFRIRIVCCSVVIKYLFSNVYLLQIIIFFRVRIYFCKSYNSS